MNELKIGILTFHCAHNYGAVLQAYSLQTFLQSLLIDCKMIDFQLPSMLDLDSVYPTHSGIRRLTKSLLLLPFHAKRISRARKFNEFIVNMFNLTEKLNCFKKSNISFDEFDCFIAGSDQIWNPKHSFSFASAFLLDFAKESQIKIAYAASIGNAKEEDLEKFKHLICRFNAISMRELRGANVISSIVNREIPVVIDPTLLIEKKYLIEISRKIKIPYNNYVLYYSLDSYKNRLRHLDILKTISNTIDLPIISITPEWPKKGLYTIWDAGPQEFLWLIQNATFVCTNSFHGTALSIAFEREFLVLEKFDGRDDRKLTILSKLGLESRMVSECAEANDKLNDKIDYARVNAILKKERFLSMKFLADTLEKGNMSDGIQF
jgi:hypothetical protein